MNTSSFRHSLFFAFVCTLFLLPLTAISATGQVVEYIGSNGAINWTKGQVIVESTSDESRSRFKACRASIVTAQRDLVEVIGQIRVDSQTVVSEGVLTEDAIRSTVRGQLRGGRVLARTRNPDGTCTVKMGVAISGPLASLIFQNQNKSKPKVQPPKPPVRTADELAADLLPLKNLISKLDERIGKIEELLEAQPELVAQIHESAVAHIPTGLVIDVRGSNFIPSVSPKLRELSGTIIFPENSELNQNSGQLVSLFMNDLSRAQNHPRVGERPLVIKALQTWEKSRTELVLDIKSANKVTQLMNSGMTGKFPVIIVLD
ncbi:MAG: hypothetical protein HQL69_07030 [Magnetococcales bacterium]|nr:hypothetical protein [Magnetococcales bacterium]